MKYALSFFSATGFILFGVLPGLTGDICSGDFACHLFFSTIGYLPYFLAWIVITFIVLTVFRSKIRFGNKLIYFVFSIFVSFILIYFHYNYLSIWIEKRELINRYKQSLNQQDYQLYEPTYLPDGHKLFESRVDTTYLSFYYTGNNAGQFFISEFKKSNQRTELSPPVCFIVGDDFEIADLQASSFSSAVYGNCQEIKTPKGTLVYLMPPNEFFNKKLAAIILGNTLITISGYNFSNQELINLIDGLEEKRVSDINFKVLDRTIGRQ